MSSAPSDPFALVGTTLDGRFAIDRVVARGGFGVVYQGRQLRLRKTIAFKVLFVPPGLDADAQRAFLDGFAQEAQTIAQLEHPAIVRVYDFGVSTAPNGKEMPWMALEWIEGKTLSDHLAARERRPLSPPEALGVLRPVFHALAFAHAQHIAHRDIKPSNIMLVGSGGSMAGTVSTRLLDFGIAKAMNPDEGQTSGETHTHALFSAFSLPYAAPEQKVGLKTGPWTDVHALGLILTELLTGQSPYGNKDRLDVEMRVLSPTRPTPALFQVDAGPWEAVIARAVAFRAPDRFQDAGAFLAALEASVPPSARTIAFNVPGTTEPVRLAFGGTSTPVAFAPSSTPAPGAVPASTITDAPTTSAARARTQPADGRRSLVVGVGLGAVALAAVVTVAVTSLLARSDRAPPLNASVGPVAQAHGHADGGNPVAPPRPGTLAAREVRPAVSPAPTAPDASVLHAAPAPETSRGAPTVALEPTSHPRRGRPHRPRGAGNAIDFRAQQGGM